MDRPRFDYSFLTCLKKIPFLTRYKNLALVLAQVKYLCMSSAHISPNEKRKFLPLQTAEFPLIRLETCATSAAVHDPGFLSFSRNT